MGGACESVRALGPFLGMWQKGILPNFFSDDPNHGSVTLLIHIPPPLTDTAAQRTENLAVLVLVLVTSMVVVPMHVIIYIR